MTTKQKKEELIKRMGVVLLEITEEIFDGNKSRLAQALNRSPQNIYQIIGQSRLPPIPFLVDMVEKFGVNPNYLFGKSENKYLTCKDELWKVLDTNH